MNKIYSLKIKKLSLVVLSSKEYEYLWNNFCNLWIKYCSNFIIEKYIITSEKNKKYKGFKVISGVSKACDPWGKRILEALKKIRSQNVLLMTDDCFVINNLDLKEMSECYNFFVNNNISYLRISVTPNENFYYKKGKYFIPYFSFHRICLQPSLWKKKYLIRLLKKQENPRQFEMNGSLRTKKSDLIYSTNYDVIKYIEFVRNGKITPEAIYHIKKKSLKINRKYKYMNFFEIFIYYYKKIKFILFYLISQNFRKYYIKYRLTKNYIAL
jgi:hypothetical protein